ncbi:MAG TPA: asparagine synthase (glutamine-hydrolyzing) [Acidimicrobiia bacterium]|jgi:asparagine synthase (glutamine-hydrolysing)|nr:asparagine synthase (glutamine-hydrolyzing) [Acidimicrobiia bacterium]
MCGIAGCYQRGDGVALTRAMTARLAHRGPDGSGVWEYERDGVRVALGHRRLSVIDLSPAAAQPFSKNGLTLTYNGELYNYAALRRELAARGVTFRSASDTEVVLEAWRRWGPDCLSRFRGMFAFAMFDERTGSLFLVRDQLGIKPLYYRARAGTVVFASELKALTSTIGSELQIDRASIVASVLYYWVPDQRCAIAGVEKLQPGTWAEFRPDGSKRVGCYWSVAEVAAEAAESEPADLGAVVEESVAAHLVADVPVSTFLSGGLDSSVITALAHKRHAGIEAYTIAFRPEDQKYEAMPDDAVYARKVAADLGMPLHEIEINPDVAAMLPRVVEALDEPTGDPAALNTILICEAARDAGAKVLLSGMGADELFGGYRKHVACVAAARYRRVPRPVRRMVRPAVDRLPVAVGNRGIRSTRWAKRFLTFAELSEEPAFRRSYTLYDSGGLERLVGPDLRGHVADVIDEHRGVYEDSRLPDHVSRMCLADTRLFLPGLNLAYTDRSSMAASTEVRVPFVDVDVVRAAFTFPGSAKIRHGAGKLALKSAARQWLPDEIVHRPKASFGAPIRSWISRELRPLVDDVLVSGDLIADGLLQDAPVRELIAEERSGREDRAKQIWQLLSLELWYRQMRALGVRS